MIVLKSYLKKSYVWVKNHWYVPIGALFALVTWFFYKQKSDVIIDNLKETRVHHKKEIAAINTIHEEQIAERDKAVESFREADEKIEADNRKNIEDSISEFAERKKAIKEKEIHDIAKELAKVVGGSKK
jgi:hypothetical protein